MARKQQLALIDPSSIRKDGLFNYLNPETIGQALEEAGCTPEKIVKALAAMAFDETIPAKQRLPMLTKLLSLPKEILTDCGAIQDVSAHAEIEDETGFRSLDVRGKSQSGTSTMELLAAGRQGEVIDCEARLIGVDEPRIGSTGSGVSECRTSDGGEKPDESNQGRPETDNGLGSTDPVSEESDYFAGGVSETGKLGTSPPDISGRGTREEQKRESTPTTTATDEPAGADTGSNHPTSNGSQSNGPVPDRDPRNGKFARRGPIQHGRGTASFAPPAPNRSDPIGVFTPSDVLRWSDTLDDGNPRLDGV